MFAYTALITLAAVILYFILAWNVGGARRKHGVAPPQTHGPAEFERVYRVHQNTLEQFPLFLPPLWLFAACVSDGWAAALGLVWLIGRVLYARGYSQDVQRRFPGFVIAMTANGFLILGALFGVLRLIIAG